MKARLAPSLLAGAAVVLLAACATAPDRPPAGAADEGGRLLEALVADDAAVVAAALERAVVSGDPGYVAVLIELLRARQLLIVRGPAPDETARALEALTGERLGEDWAAWLEWYGSTGLSPPRGFLGWKGRLLGRIDPGFARFLAPGFQAGIRVEGIVWGGVAVDGIPALDRPATVPGGEAGYLEPDDPVFGLAVNGEARAYPLRIMDWHELANDVVGGVPVSLAYCTLCGTAIAYDGRAPDGSTYTFGTSGLLYESNKLMYDRRTGTLWNQLTGEPAVGPLVEEPPTLERIPVVVTTWEAWRSQHPDTTVLSLDTGYLRDYSLGAAYGTYFRSETTLFPVWRRRALLPEKSRIFGLELEGVAKAYPLEALTRARVVNDEVAGVPVVLVATRGEVTAFPEPVDYQVGAEVRAYARGATAFRPATDPDVVRDAAGRPWRVTEEALVGPSGERAPRLHGAVAYWFGWYAFYPRTLVYGAPS